MILIFYCHKILSTLTIQAALNANNTVRQLDIKLRLSIIGRLFWIIKQQEMSFIERLKKNTQNHHIKQPKYQRDPLKRQKKMGETNKPHPQHQDFHQHHSDIKLILKLLQSPSDQPKVPVYQNNRSVQPSRNREKSSVHEPPKQNFKSKTRRDQPNSELPGSTIKFRKLSQQLQDRQMKKHVLPGPTLIKNRFNPCDNKNRKLLLQNPQSTKNSQQNFSAKLETHNGNVIKRSGKRGLQNFGNTCYINSVLQALFHFPDFSHGLQQQLYCQNKVQEFATVEQYLKLYQAVINKNSKQNGALSTLSLKQTVSKTCKMFIDFQQEDAHQFLRKLLDTMHSEINRVEQRPKHKYIPCSLIKDNLPTIALEFQKSYKLYDDSYIYDVFCGQICTFINCSNCNHQSLSLECFLDISLPIIKGLKSVEQLMSTYFDSQRLWGFYECKACQKSVKNSTKTIDLWNPPNNLIIQLKRSQFGNKNVDRIKIPVNRLNMKKYMKNRTDKVQKSAIYRLRSIVHHRGADDGGHYWVTVRQNAQWYTIDDENVSLERPSHIQKQLQTNGSDTAYLLFYEII